MSEVDSSMKPPEPRKPHAFRRAVVRGLGIVMPPLLTIVLFMWVWNIVEMNVLQPAESAAQRLFVWLHADIVESPPADAVIKDVTDHGQRVQMFTRHETDYVCLPDGRYVNREHFHEFYEHKSKKDRLPADADEFYKKLAQLKYPRRILLPIALLLFVLLMYLLGRLVAFSVGRMLWNGTEAMVNRVPVIRNVYSSVKQVTDLFFSDREEARFTRVVAVEYPRKGAWALAFVTGEGFADVRATVKDPIVALLIPTSPMPAAGFTTMVRKSDTIDLNITIDQAIQFIVSCGVVSPPYTYPPDAPRISQQVIDAVKQPSSSGNGPADWKS